MGLGWLGIICPTLALWIPRNLVLKRRTNIEISQHGPHDTSPKSPLFAVRRGHNNCLANVLPMKKILVANLPCSLRECCIALWLSVVPLHRNIEVQWFPRRTSFPVCIFPDVLRRQALRQRTSPTTHEPFWCIPYLHNHCRKSNDVVCMSHCRPEGPDPSRDLRDATTKERLLDDFQSVVKFSNSTTNTPRRNMTVRYKPAVFWVLWKVAWFIRYMSRILTSKICADDSEVH